MRRQTMRHAMAILLGILLAVVGGALGNVVSDQLPSEVVAPLQRAAPPRPRGHHPGSSCGDAALGSGAGQRRCTGSTSAQPLAPARSSYLGSQVRGVRGGMWFSRELRRREHCHCMLPLPQVWLLTSRKWWFDESSCGRGVDFSSEPMNCEIAPYRYLRAESAPASKRLTSRNQCACVPHREKPCDESP